MRGPFNLMILLAFSLSAYTQDIKTDSLSVNMSLSDFIKTKFNWLNRIGFKEFKLKGVDPDTLSWFSLTPLREGFYLRAISENKGITKVYLHYPNYSKREKTIDYRAPNIKYTLEQELCLPLKSGIELQRKSVIAHIGLTTINSGLGMLYAEHNNPVIKPNIFLISAYTAIDAALVVGLFTKSDIYRTTSYICLPLFKIVTLLYIPLINWNNTLADTKYKFSFK